MTLRPFIIPYHFNGRDYTLDIHAHDFDDARRRLRAAYLQGREPEEIIVRTQAPGWLGRIMGAK